MKITWKEKVVKRNLRKKIRLCRTTAAQFSPGQTTNTDVGSAAAAQYVIGEKPASCEAFLVPSSSYKGSFHDKYKLIKKSIPF